MRKYLTYTDNDIIQYSKEVTSLSQLLLKLGLKAVGGNYANMKRKLKKLSVDTNHWKGMGWSKDEQLKDWDQYTRPANVKKHLIAKKSNTCEICKNTIWLGFPIKLELHHLDGNKTNNSLENLQLLCPNCHSFTPDYRNPAKNFNLVASVGLEPTL